MLPKENEKENEIFDGYKYRFEKVFNDGTRSYVCIKSGKKSLDCRGRFLKRPDGTREVTIGHFSHPKEPKLERQELFQETLRIRALSESGSLQDIYRRTEKRFLDVSSLTSYDAQKNLMTYARSKSKQKVKRVKGIRSIVDFAKDLKQKAEKGENPLKHETQNQHNNAEKDALPEAVLQFKIVNEEDKTHVILYDNALLEKLKDSKESHIDATFGSRPRLTGCRQLLTIMTRLYDQAFPCVWVFMSSKCKKSYTAVFTAVKEIWPDWKPEKFHSDFEEGLMNSINETLGNQVEVIGCFFHFCQALFKYALELGIAIHRNSEKNHAVHFVLLQTMALALIPKEDIEPELKKIIVAAKMKFGDKFDNFFEYVERYWIKRRGVNTFCVFGQMRRTNNAIESYHRDLNMATKHQRPNVYALVDIILDLNQSNHAELKREEESFTPPKRINKISQYNDKLIKDGWDKLKLNTPDFRAEDFINMIASDLKHNKKDMMKDMENDLREQIEDERKIEYELYKFICPKTPIIKLERLYPVDPIGNKTRQTFSDCNVHDGISKIIDDRSQKTMSKLKRKVKNTENEDKRSKRKIKKKIDENFVY